MTLMRVKTAGTGIESDMDLSPSDYVKLRDEAYNTLYASFLADGILIQSGIDGALRIASVSQSYGKRSRPSHPEAVLLRHAYSQMMVRLADATDRKMREFNRAVRDINTKFPRNGTYERYRRRSLEKLFNQYHKDITNYIVTHHAPKLQQRVESLIGKDGGIAMDMGDHKSDISNEALARFFDPSPEHKVVDPETGEYVHRMPALNSLFTYDPEALDARGNKIKSEPIDFMGHGLNSHARSVSKNLINRQRGEAFSLDQPFNEEGDTFDVADPKGSIPDDEDAAADRHAALMRTVKSVLKKIIDLKRVVQTARPGSQEAAEARLLLSTAEAQSKKWIPQLMKLDADMVPLETRTKDGMKTEQYRRLMHEYQSLLDQSDDIAIPQIMRDNFDAKATDQFAGSISPSKKKNKQVVDENGMTADGRDMLTPEQNDDTSLSPLPVRQPGAPRLQRKQSIGLAADNARSELTPDQLEVMQQQMAEYRKQLLPNMYRVQSWAPNPKRDENNQIVRPDQKKLIPMSANLLKLPKYISDNFYDPDVLDNVISDDPDRQRGREPSALFAHALLKAMMHAHDDDVLIRNTKGGVKAEPVNVRALKYLQQNLDQDVAEGGPLSEHQDFMQDQIGRFMQKPAALTDAMRYMDYFKRAAGYEEARNHPTGAAGNAWHALTPEQRMQMVNRVYDNMYAAGFRPMHVTKWLDTDDIPGAKPKWRPIYKGGRNLDPDYAKEIMKGEVDRIHENIKKKKKPMNWVHNVRPDDMFSRKFYLPYPTRGTDSNVFMSWWKSLPPEQKQHYSTMMQPAQFSALEAGSVPVNEPGLDDDESEEMEPMAEEDLSEADPTALVKAFRVYDMAVKASRLEASGRYAEAALIDQQLSAMQH